MRARCLVQPTPRRVVPIRSILLFYHLPVAYTFIFISHFRANWGKEPSHFQFLPFLLHFFPSPYSIHFAT